MVEHERVNRRGPARDLLNGLRLHLVLDATASERAALAAVGIDDHHRPGLLRRRASRLHDLADDRFALLFPGS